MEQMHDLSFDLMTGGTIRLHQMDYAGESSIIDLHLAQLRYIAERAGLLLAPIPMVSMPGYMIADDDDGDEMQHLAIEADDDGPIHLYQTRVSGMGGTDEHVILHPTQAAWLGVRLLAFVRRAKPVPAPVEAAGGSLLNVAGCAGGSAEPSLF